MKAEWDKDGNPKNLLAAAEDAYEWLISIHSDSMTQHEWGKFSCAKQEMRKFLDEAQK